eukprot:1765827-Pleurochrysis_carterae.AAC.1
MEWPAVVGGGGLARRHPPGSVSLRAPRGFRPPCHHAHSGAQGFGEAESAAEWSKQRHGVLGTREHSRKEIRQPGSNRMCCTPRTTATVI